MISQDTAAAIWKSYREIEVAESLLSQLSRLSETTDTFEKSAPKLKDAFGRRRHFELGIPSGPDSTRLFEVSPDLAHAVIRAHIANKRAELAGLQEQARIELSSQ